MAFLVAMAALATLPTHGQTLQIQPAVKIVYPTLPNTAYQVESSKDLVGWQPFQSVVVGNGSPNSILTEGEESPRFFRLTTNAVRDVGPILEPIRVANKVPALGCAVILSNRLVGIGVTGLRKAGVTNAPVTLNDKWHHGSLTKSMTATLAAIMVQQGAIRWDSTLAEIFPDVAPAMNTAWREVTLEQLTANRGGAPGDLGNLWSQLWNYKDTPRSARRFLLENLTDTPPSSPPGTQYEYSNAGFAIAGHMLETVANKPWEELITERLFAPLGMSSAGFGPPATPRYINHPWGHQLAGGQPSPIEPGTNADNPSAIGPAGTVHCSLIDLAKYVAFHVAGHNADTALLPRNAVVKLHTALPNNANYAHGWLEIERPWGNPGKVYNHNGSNTQWFSVIWFAPARQFAVIGLCNLATSSGANPGATATDQAVGKMIQEFLN